MVNYAYTDSTGRKITKTAYDAQKRAWADVSWYKPISSTPTAPAQPTSTPVQSTSTPVQAQINKDVTKPTVSPVGWLSDAMKATDTYKNLLAQWYTEEDISSKVSAYQEKRQKQEPSTTTSTDTTTQWQYQGLQWDVELKPVQWGDGWINLYKWFADYQDVSDKRLTEIASNVLSYYQTNPNAFGSYGDFKKFFSYNDRADQQKMVLDSFRKNKQYSDMFNGMSVEDISSAFSSWALSQEQITALSQLNPDLYMQVQSYMNTQNSYNNANSAVTGNPIQAYMQSIWIEMPETPDLMSKYKELVNTEEIQQYQTKANELQWQIEKIDEQIFSMRDTIEQQYAWTGMTRDVIDAITADRTEALNKQKRTLSIDYNTNLNQYNSLYKAATDEFGIYEKQLNVDRQQWKDSMEALWFYYQYTPQGMSEMSAAKYNAENPDLDTATTESQKRMALNKSLYTYYEDFWAIIQRPQAQVVSDVIKYAQQKWISLSQALKENFVIPLQSKNEYKYMLNQSMWISNKPIDIWWQLWQQDSSWNRWKVTTPTTVSQFSWTWMSGAWLRNNNPWNIKDTTFGNVIWVGANNFAQFATPEDWFDALVEKIKFNQTNTKSKYYWNTLLQYFQKYAPSTDWNNPQAYAQEVANKLWVSINTKISDVDAIQFAAAIAKHDSWYDYSTYGQFRWQESLWYDQSLSWVFEAMSQNKWKIDSTTQKALKELWIDATQLGSQYNAWKTELSNEIKPHAKSLLSNIEKLKWITKDQYNWMTLNIPRTPWAALRAELNQMTSSMALQKLIELKSQWATFGALSDNELRFIDDAAWWKKFSTRLSYKDWKANMDEFDRILRKLESSVWGSNVILNTTQTQDQWVWWVTPWYFEFWTLFSLTQ